MKILFFLWIFLPAVSFAQSEHKLVRRISVFPISVEREYAQEADETWWTVREALTNDKRFLVASKNFLIKKDVHQARKELTPADAIILSQLLDAHCLVTTYLDGRTLKMRAYEGVYGRLLWSSDFAMHPSLGIRDQLNETAKKMTLDFIASFPYQGQIIVDNIIGRPIYKENEQVFTRVAIAANSQISEGDPVQVIRVYSKSLEPLFGDGGTVEVFAEGRVTQIKNRIATVQILRATRNKEIFENSLVRFPNELKRLHETYSMQQSLAGRISPEFLNPEMSTQQQAVEEYKPLVTSLSYILSIAAYFILAF